MKLYAGIGARDTPVGVKNAMIMIASGLQSKGYILRSGGANGADSAFEFGADKDKEIFLPWRGYNDNTSTLYNPTHDTKTIAAKFHPSWGRCSHGVRKLHGRNVHIVLGADLNTPVEFVVCWTKDGKDSGGTGMAIRVAKHYNIPVYNLHNVIDCGIIMDMVN